MSEKIAGVGLIREANPLVGVSRAMEADYSCRQLAATTWRRLTEKLVRGQESASQLQNLFCSPAASEQERRVLAAEVLRYFTEALSILGYSGDDLRCQDYSLCSDLDSGDCTRSAAKQEPGRGHKRRRRVAETRIVVAPTAEDGHAWRKYGQKTILNAKHPRSYFRCTHKYDQGCGATKQVQRMEGDSEIYKITYIADHTCGRASTIIAAAAEHPLSVSDSFNICFSDSGNDRRDDSSRRIYLPADDDAAKGGETTSGVTDETDLWLELKDFGDLQETAATATATANQYCFAIGDDADSHMFGMELYGDFRFN